MKTQEPTYVIRGVPAQLVEHFWPFAVPYIKRALDKASGEYTVDDFKQNCMERALQLWLVSKEQRIFGAITTEIVIYPQRKHCRVITLAGSDFPSWVDVANATLDAWAKEQGCDAMEAYVRRGLVDVLNPLGYKQKHVVLIKELQNV